MIHYLTYKSKNDNSKCCHDAFLNELNVFCVYSSQSLAYFQVTYLILFYIKSNETFLSTALLQRDKHSKYYGKMKYTFLCSDVTVHAFSTRIGLNHSTDLE